MNCPAMVRIKQHFNTNSIKDIPAAVRAEISKIKPREIIKPGNSVAITAGSRGIANIKTILAEVVSELKNRCQAVYRAGNGEPWWRNQ